MMGISRFALAAVVALAAGGVARAQGITTVESVDSVGNPGIGSSGSDFNEGDQGVALSADGAVVAFASKATRLVAGDTNGRWDVFVHDRATGVTERVSVDSSGGEANADSRFPALSADGRIVAFESAASNLVAGDANGRSDLFVHDRATGITERVSVDSSGAQGNDASHGAALSADGRFVAFASLASNLVAGDSNGAADVFLRDRFTQVTERVSVDTGGAQANDASSERPALSADGSVVAFTSLASNLVAGDTNGASDVFVRDRAAGTTERASVDSAGNETAGLVFDGPALSGDGRFVAFESDATDLVPNDTNGWEDVFVHDRWSRATERASVATSGAQAKAPCHLPAISADGRFVAFTTFAQNLVPGDTNVASDVFVHDRLGGFTDCVSVAPTGSPADWDSRLAALAGDGQVVVFASRADDLVAGVSGWQVYARERCTALASWTNYGAGLAGSFGVPTFTSEDFPAIGTTLTLDLANSAGVFTAAALLVGTQRATIHSSLGGDLLLVPTFNSLMVLPPIGAALSGDIPRDDSLCGIVVDFQALELDPGAPKGVSFTPGLELAIGR